MVTLIYSDVFLEHRTGPYHPERPQRLTAIVEHLKSGPWAPQLAWQEPTPLETFSPQAWVEKIHHADYLQLLSSLSERLEPNQRSHLDPDTVVSQNSYQVALLAVNAWIDGIQETLTQAQPCLVLARPPGHHALPERAMGFCLLANAAIAAHYALSLPKINRVGIFDWDVHHGNGTQACVETIPNIAYCSIHQAPHYPGTGAAHEQGQHQNVLNIPMAAGSGGAEYFQAMTTQVIPFFQAFAPDLLLVSAGYDAHRDDPLSETVLAPTDYGQMTRLCQTISPHVVFGLEGGYDLQGLATSVEATISACLE